MNEDSVNVVLTKYVIQCANNEIMIENLKQEIETLRLECDELKEELHGTEQV